MTASQGWRWGYWYVAIFNGALTLAMVFLLEETKYVPSIVIDGSPIAENQERSEEQSSEKPKPVPNDGVSNETEIITGSQIRRHIDSSIPIKSYWKRMSLITTTPSSLQHENHNFIRHFWQPFVVLCLFPAIAFGALQWGFAFSSLSVMLVTQAAFYPAPPYNFSPIGVGNVIIAPAIGGILGSIVGGIATDWLILKLARRNGGIYEPEMRLQMFIVPGVALPVGIFMYGLTIAVVRWSMPDDMIMRLMWQPGSSLDHQLCRRRVCWIWGRRLWNDCGHIHPGFLQQGMHHLLLSVYHNPSRRIIIINLDHWRWFRRSHVHTESPRYNPCIRPSSMGGRNGCIQHVCPFGMLSCARHCDLCSYVDLGKEVAPSICVTI